MKLILVAAAALLAACASKTDVVEIGDGIYMLGMQDYSLNYSGTKVKAQLYQEASQFCAQRGKRSSPVGDSARDAAMYSNYASAEVKFRCV